MNKATTFHDKRAPFWALAMIVLVLTGMSTIWLDGGGFWKSYVLDMAGPAWNYILFRGLFTGYKDNWWTRFFNPLNTFVIFILVLFGIEIMQYFEVYDSTYDPWDFIAYISLLLPIFIIDLNLVNESDKA